MRQPRIESDPAVERFADDLELPLNSRPKHRVGKVVGKGLARRESCKQCAGLLDVEKVGADLTLRHR
jgi:hypothetical protein